MNVAYSYSWSLHDSDFAQVCDIIESLRKYAIELGGEMVSDRIVQPDTSQVHFVATIPGSSEGKYGLSFSENHSWSWTGTTIISSAKTIGEFHSHAASHGIEVIESYAGMIFTSKRNVDGVVETDQRPAFDWTDF